MPHMAAYVGRASGPILEYGRVRRLRTCAWPRPLARRCSCIDSARVHAHAWFSLAEPRPYPRTRPLGLVRLSAAAMRIWMDMTAPAHVLVFRPIIERLRAQGHDVELTARDYAQTVQLLELHGIEARVFGRHGGASRSGKLAALVSRTVSARRFASKRGFDLAVAHGSNDLAIAAASLGVPSLNTFDYEFAATQHHIGCRLAKRVMIPDRIPADRMERYGAGPDKLVQYPGLKEEYYLADFEPDRGIMERLGVDQDRVSVIVRPPPDVSLY